MEILRVLEQGELASEQHLRYTSEYGECAICYSDEESDEALTQEGLMEWIRLSELQVDDDHLYVVINANSETIAEASYADAFAPPLSLDKMTCKSCKITAFRFFMLHDELWNRCAARADVLCFSCAQVCLGRPFTIGDFTNAPVNGWIFDAVASGLHPDPTNIMPATLLREKRLRMEIIRIPAVEKHNGFLVLEVWVPWFCLYCGAERGEPRNGSDFDGSRRLTVTTWQNSCGHAETYKALRDWIKAGPGAKSD